MRMSKLLGRRTRDRDGSSEEAASHRLLHRAGYVRQHAAGIYSYLAPGLRCLRNIERIVRAEMERAGAHEILMPVVHSADPWKRTGRHETIDETLVRFRDRHGRDMVLAMTHEEIVAELAASDVRSYRDADVVVYQIQTKFRDELRPRGGLLRTREFIMKDAYSLHVDEAGLAEAYEAQARAYGRIYRRLGLRDVHRIRGDSGVMGGSVADEFMCLLDVGEDDVAFCDACGSAWNAEASGKDRCETCGGAVRHGRGVEVGNIFQLGTRYSEALGARVSDRSGADRPLVMGSYGIGISRLLPALVEQHHDVDGIALPAAVAAFDGHLVVLGDAGGRLAGIAAEVYAGCEVAGVGVLWDDRGVAAGEQLADADLIGAPIRITVGRSALERAEVELRERRTGKVHRVSRVSVGAAVARLRAELLAREGAAA